MEIDILFFLSRTTHQMHSGLMLSLLKYCNKVSQSQKWLVSMSPELKTSGLVVCATQATQSKAMPVTRTFLRGSFESSWLIIMGNNRGLVATWRTVPTVKRPRLRNNYSLSWSDLVKTNKVAKVLVGEFVVLLMLLFAENWTGSAHAHKSWIKVNKLKQ